ncbi:MAG: hypothetical protein AAGU14_02640 [Eubacteriaceae bacterium]
MSTLVATYSVLVRGTTTANGITCQTQIYKVSQDTATNTTTYQAVVKLLCTNDASYHLDDNGVVTIRVAGVTSLSATSCTGFDFRSSTSVTIYTGSTTVTHDTDGTFSEIFSTICKYDSTGSYANGTGSGTVAFDTIPRASEIGTISNFNLEDTFSVPIDKKSSSFTDDLVIKQGETVIKTITDYASGANINLTDAELLNAYNAIDKTAAFTFETTTKSGSTTIGTDSAEATGIAAGTAYIKTGGSWKRALPYLKVNGVWEKAIANIKSGGSWKRGIG